MDTLQRVVLIIVIAVILIIVITAAIITIYYLFFRKTTFPLPTVEGVSTTFATSSTANSSTSQLVPNGSNSLKTFTTGGTAIGCTAALNENAIGYKVINNSGITQSFFLNDVYFASTTCSGTRNSFPLFVVNPFSTVNWNDKSTGTDSNGILIYPTFYLNCEINALTTSSSGTVQTNFYPGGTDDIDINKQYYEITFNSNGSSQGRAVNATTTKY